jgi:hypothetical protein
MRRSLLVACVAVVALAALAAAHDAHRQHHAGQGASSISSSAASEDKAVPWTAPDACRRMPHFLLETLTRNATLAAFARSRHLSAERARWSIEATAAADDESFAHMEAAARAVSGANSAGLLFSNKLLDQLQRKRFD